MPYPPFLTTDKECPHGVITIPISELSEVSMNAASLPFQALLQIRLLPHYRHHGAPALLIKNNKPL